MKNKKKIIITAAVVIVILAIAAAAFYFVNKNKAQKPPSLQEAVESRISAYDTDLKDSLTSMTDQDQVRKYLSNWAENKGIDVKTDKYDNVIFSVKATEGLEDKAPAVIICGYDYTCMSTYSNSIVSALTIAKNDQPHGAYKVIFVSEEGGSMSSAENLSSQYFEDGADVFYLGSSVSSRVANMTGGFEEYSLSKALSHKSPSYTKAYKISISGLPAQKFGTESAYVPNPIKTLGNQLANLKSGSIWFELASFDGGSRAGVTPSEATATIVVSEDISEKLERKLDSAIEKFIDKYGADYPSAQYTYEIVDTPSSVMSSENTDAIVSLMYTAMNGVHYKDDNGDIASLTNIGYVNTSDKEFVMNVAASSWDQNLLAEISEAYQTAGGLSGFEYSVTSQYAPFALDESNQPFEMDFRNAYSDYQNIKLDSINTPELTPCGIIKSKNENTHMIILGVTEKTKDNFAGGIITYLMTPSETDGQQ